MLKLRLTLLPVSDNFGVGGWPLRIVKSIFLGAIGETDGVYVGAPIGECVGLRVGGWDVVGKSVG